MTTTLEDLEYRLGELQLSNMIMSTEWFHLRTSIESQSIKDLAEHRLTEMMTTNNQNIMELGWLIEELIESKKAKKFWQFWK
jgi:hypothetical protein